MKKYQKRRNLFCDFETTAYGVGRDEVRVYLWVAIDEDGKETHGFTIDSFVDYIINKKVICYFHNARFDFSYIEGFLLKNDIKFDVLEKQGILYQVTIGEAQIRDSMNLLPMSLKEVGENYCELYKKTSIDYTVSYFHEATKEEIEYCINDCLVLREGLMTYWNALEDILKEAECPKTLLKVRKLMTNAGIAYSAFCEMSNFKKCCPKTTLKEFRAFRPAYKGGYVYSYPNGIVKNVTMIDNNSMYPYVYSSFPLPVGRPKRCEKFSDLNEWPFYILQVNIKFELKEEYIAIIGGGIGRFGGTEYLASSDGEYKVMTFCKTDFEMIQEFYDIDFFYIWGFGFEVAENMFKKYADTFIKYKQKYKGVKRNVCKVLLNSPYGRLAMSGEQEIVKYKLDEDGVVDREVIGYEVDEDVFQYLPMAIAITAGARYVLLSAGKKVGFKNIQYMDTDSIKFIGTLPEELDIDDNRLGAWKVEGRPKYFKTIACKKYVYYEDNQLFYTCAGVRKDVLIRDMRHSTKQNPIYTDEKEALKYIKKFAPGISFNVLQQKKVKGGRALLPIVKTLN